ncbi:helix-loop-helix protein delilah-like [Hydractinia symbiolongicarpus]|uniref:helix-loop-helix protein delilah-like n=1 Tax=Hydractinia symbiolongicarpus TaxID=13093 RepID=UPI00254C7799|nr:helix-loop-helix protein delilah-like [Hydractinia symbiolongicarpus]
MEYYTLNSTHMLTLSNSVPSNIENNPFHLPKQNQTHYLHHDAMQNPQRTYEHGFHLPIQHDNSIRNLITRNDSPGLYPQYQPMLYAQHNLWQEFDSGINYHGLQDPMQRSSKHKRPRMSLQKRLLVNARERERMRVLNKAFESLRDALPCYIADGHMAKITTLRLAINYIKALTDLLNQNKSKDSVEHSEEINQHDELLSNILNENRKDEMKPSLTQIDNRLMKHNFTRQSEA